MEKRIAALETQIEKVKQELLTLGDLRPGSISKQYNVCGSAKCRCKDDPPQKHGPYYQLSFTRKGKSGTKFIKKPHLATVRRQLKDYARLRKLVDRWVELSMELCQLKLEWEAD
jgi:hypothetical protein